jgi:hypothetical protein
LVTVRLLRENGVTWICQVVLGSEDGTQRAELWVDSEQSGIRTGFLADKETTDLCFEGVVKGHGKEK